MLRQFAAGIRALFRREESNRELSDEVDSYLEHSIQAFQARGHSPEDARRAARLEFGGETAVREQVRTARWEDVILTSLTDIRHAGRRLRRCPGFTTISIVTLALGLGASTAIFSVVEGVLLKPLPYRDPQQLVAVRHTAPGIHIPDLNMAPSLFFTYADENRVFQDLAMWSPDTGSVTGLGPPEEVPALDVTHGFLTALAVTPQIGRAFTANDEDPKSPRTLMLSYGYWQSRFGGDTSVPGRPITVDGDSYEVIGVLPPSFQFMDRKFSLLVPLRFNRATVRLFNFCCQGLARLKPGITTQQANADIARMLPMAPEKFAMNPGLSPTMFQESRIGPNLRLMKDEWLGDIGNTIWVLMGTVGIVLLIACANVANLLLVRVDGRRQELAVRAALGAGWARMARELLLESLLMGIAGGALGLVLAYLWLKLLAVYGPSNLPRVHEIALDPIVLAFTLAISIGAGLLFGAITVLKNARPQLLSGLRGGGRTLSHSKERHRARNVLVVVQVALALVLLVGSGLMIRTFQALRHVDPGFSLPEQLETFRIYIPDTQAKEPERVIRIQQEILGKLKSIAGVNQVGIVNRIPLEGGSNNSVYAEGQEAREGATPPNRRYKAISPDYVAALGARLIAGREITWLETYNQSPLVLVSENMAREIWHDPQAALGKRIRMTLKDDWREIIGVIADLRDDGVDQKSPAIAYWPLLQRPYAGAPKSAARTVSFIIRTPRAGSTAFRQELQQAVAAVNPNLPLADLRTLQSVYDRSLARTSFTLALLAVAGGMALLLGVIGIYGVISYAVSQRTREIGIRLALGAPLPNVTRMFVRHGLAMSAIGALCGLAAAFALSRLMKSVLYEVSPADPITYVAVSAILILAAAMASYLPARRATKVDPMSALRSE